MVSPFQATIRILMLPNITPFICMAWMIIALHSVLSFVNPDKYVNWCSLLSLLTSICPVSGTFSKPSFLIIYPRNVKHPIAFVCINFFAVPIFGVGHIYCPVEPLALVGRTIQLSVQVYSLSMRKMSRVHIDDILYSKLVIFCFSICFLGVIFVKTMNHSVEWNDIFGGLLRHFYLLSCLANKVPNNNGLLKVECFW